MSEAGRNDSGPDALKPITVFVDADATPRDALASVDRLAARFGAQVVSVSSINHSFDRPGHITVDPHPQAVDMEIVRLLQIGRPQVVVTQDYGLAALSLGKGAAAVSPTGQVFTAENIDRFLFERDLHARERRSRGRSRGPKKRTQADRDHFSKSLEAVLQSLTARHSPPP